MPSPLRSVSIVIPCYRSGPWIDELVERIGEATDELRGRRELLLVDDASPDETTWPAIRRAARRYDWVRGIGLQFNVGQFRALLAGMARARGEWIVTMDDDLQTPPEEIPRLVAAAAAHPEMDVVIGAYGARSHDLVRRLGSRGVAWLYARLYGKPRHLQSTSFRILHRRLARVLCAHGTRRPLMGALILQSTTPQRMMNVPVEHHPRPHGHSGYTFSRLVNLALDNVVNASTLPLRGISLLGLGVAAGSFVLALFYFGLWLTAEIREPGFTTLVLLLTFIAGTGLFSIGVVGEYVQRVVTEVSGQPLHVVREETAPAPQTEDEAVWQDEGDRSPPPPRLLVLGAGPLQAPLVRRAGEMGLEVVTADNLPGNVAHALADASVVASTRDPGAVLRAAHAHRVDAVATACSDVAVPTLAVVADALGLPGVPLGVARCWTRKDAFRRFQRDAGLPHPAWVAGRDAEALLREARRLEGPVVVKPVDRSGSRAVRVLPSAEDAGLADAVRAALAASFVAAVCVEQYVAGPEYGGDGVVQGGNLVRLFATAKQLEGCATRGHVLPSGLAPAVEAALRESVQAHVSAAGLRDGIVNVDLRLQPDGQVRVLEMSPRLGGNWIPELVRHVHGVDLYRQAVELALGRRPQLAPGVAPLVGGPAATHVLGALHAGTVRELPDEGALRERLPHLVKLELDVAVGDKVEPFHDSSAQVGRALFRLEGTGYAETARLLDETFSAGVKE